MPSNPCAHLLGPSCSGLIWFMNSLGYNGYYCWFSTTRNTRLCLCCSAVHGARWDHDSSTAECKFFWLSCRTFSALPCTMRSSPGWLPCSSRFSSWCFRACCVTWCVTSSGSLFHPTPAPFTPHTLCIAFLPSIGKISSSDSLLGAFSPLWSANFGVFSSCCQRCRGHTHRALLQERFFSVAHKG